MFFSRFLLVLETLFCRAIKLLLISIFQCTLLDIQLGAVMCLMLARPDARRLISKLSCRIWLPCWLLRSMVVTGKGMWPKPNTNAPPNQGYGILPDQHTHQLQTTSAGSTIFEQPRLNLVATFLCSDKIICVRERGFVKKKGVRDKVQKDLGGRFLLHLHR